MSARARPLRRFSKTRASTEARMAPRKALLFCSWRMLAAAASWARTAWSSWGCELVKKRQSAGAEVLMLRPPSERGLRRISAAWVVGVGGAEFEDEFAV